MASYGIVSDIHGNITALEAVWRKLDTRDLLSRMILNAGDSVAYGSNSAACIDFLRSCSQVVSVGGNYDYNVADYLHSIEKFERKWQRSRPDKLNSIRDASGQISEDQREWLRNLPSSLDLDIEGQTVYLGHYSPLGAKRGIGSWTTDSELSVIADECSFDIIIVGHTHTPFVRRSGGTLFVNPGSVGRSWGLPSFAILTVDEGKVSCEVVT